MRRLSSALIAVGLTAVSGLLLASPAEAAVKTHTIFSYKGYGDYQGELRSVRTDRAAKVKISATCDSPNYNFVRVSWNGKPDFDYDSYRISPRSYSGKGTSNLYPEEKRGYFEVTTQDDCRVTVTVTQRY